MSAEAKRVKIITLLEIALGLVLLVFGVVIKTMGNPTAAPLVVAGEGLVTLFFGGRGALIANVPARIGKLATLAFIMLLVQVACVVGAVMIIGPENVGNDPAQVAVACLPVPFTLAIALQSRGMAKRAER
ncbi:MAG: hypothetical protein Q4B54_09640 [Coriobacteriales bacterium]|nr:hypothetical protein [Coriobacteriales bacterium]